MDYGKETIRALAGDDFGRLHWVEYRQAQHGKPTGLYLAHDKAGAVPLDNPLRGRHPTGDLEAPVLPIPFNVAEFIAFEDMAGPLGLVEQLSDEERQALRKSAPAAHALVVAVLKGPPAQHGAGPTHWTIENAAAAIAAQEGWHNEARDTLCEQMMQAARDGVLTVRHPHTGLPYRPDPVRKFYETVTPADANAWLALDPVQTLRRHGPAPVTAEPVARDASAPADELVFPLAQSLAPWFNCRLDQVPDKWRAKLEQAALPHWDDMNAAGRLSWAEQFDAQSDPAREHERNAAWQYVVRRNDLLSEQAKLEAMQPDKPSELAIRRQELARIALDLSDLESRSTAEPAATVGAPAPAPAEADVGPLPLTTGNIAFCFSGLRYTEAKWKKPLGDKPKWLEACVAIPGLQGVRETRWDPVCIGGALVRNGHVNARNVRAKFQSQPMLALWLDAWKTYEAGYIESD